MKKPRHILLALLGAGLAAVVSATAIATKPAEGGSGVTAEGPPVSPEVRQMLHDVSADRIQQSIEKLVSFGTRHTLRRKPIPTAGSALPRTGSSISFSKPPPHPTVG
jgi:hypothetical protein